MISYKAVDGSAPTHYREGLIDAYIQVFAGAPYHETYTSEEVLEKVWEPHAQDGIVIVALDDEQVVGFGCAVPILKAPDDVKGFVVQNQPEGYPLGRTWYMSELGVLGSHRKRGIAYQLVKQRMDEIVRREHDHYVFRTAAEGSNSLHLYTKIGAAEVAAVQDISLTAQVLDNGSHSDKRIYLHGRCSDALATLATLGH